MAFLDALIGSVSDLENIVPHRIFVTGISNGAAMAYDYACGGKTAVAAVGSVAGTMPGGCRGTRPVSVMGIHGLGDQNIPFAGSVGSKSLTQINWPSVETTLEHFRQTDHCPASKDRRAGVVEYYEARCADGRMICLITITDVGHQWRVGGAASTDRTAAPA